MLTELAIAVFNARIELTFGGSVTSLGGQGEPRPLGSFVDRERELSESRAALANVTPDHSHLLLLSGSRESARLGWPISSNA
jgi:hypothetical protein